MRLDLEKIEFNSKLISRLAPTPSGFLHIGNGVNFVLTYLLTKVYDGILYLRIDDIDVERVRKKYIENIFYSLEFLGIEWDRGACGVEDYYANYTFAKRRYVYDDALKSFRDFVYPCECSRKQIADASQNGLYPQTCLHKNLNYNPSRHTLRLRSSSSMEVVLDAKNISVQKSLGDVVLWRKGDLPSFVFSSTIDDLAIGTNLFIRGQDLFNTSVLQICLSSLMGKDISKGSFLHHKLLLDVKGQKLSKSTHAPSLLETASRTRVYAKVAKLLALPSKASESLKTLEEALFSSVGGVKNI